VSLFPKFLTLLLVLHIRVDDQSKVLLLVPVHLVDVPEPPLNQNSAKFTRPVFLDVFKLFLHETPTAFLVLGVGEPVLADFAHVAVFHVPCVV